MGDRKMLELEKPKVNSVVGQLSRDFIDSLDDVDMRDFETNETEKKPPRGP